MKKTTRLTLSLTLLTAAITAASFGCASFGSRPPTKFEQGLFDVQTNLTPVFRYITNHIYLTNIVDAKPVIVTNTIVEQKTELVPTYVFTPNTNATVITEIGRTTGNFFGVGGAVGTALAALFGTWASLRSHKQGQINSNLAQAIETARSILLTTPKGQDLDREFMTWLVKHQAEAGVLQQVTDLVDRMVDAPAADEVANAIKTILGPKPTA